MFLCHIQSLLGTNLGYISESRDLERSTGSISEWILLKVLKSPQWQTKDHSLSCLKLSYILYLAYRNWEEGHSFSDKSPL